MAGHQDLAGALLGHENYQEIDFQLFATSRMFNRFFSCSNVVAGAAPVNSTTYFLKDEKGSQVLYIPDGARAIIRVVALVDTALTTAGTDITAGTVAATNFGSAISTQGAIYVARDDAAITMQLQGTASDAAGTALNLVTTFGGATLQVLVNNTVFGLEFVLADSSATASLAVVSLDIFNLPSPVYFQYGIPSTAARTTVETFI